MFILNKWNDALIFSLVNSGVFLSLSILLFLFSPSQRLIILSVPFLFLIGSIFLFFLLIRSGASLIPFSWFVLGSGIFFGFGVVAGGLNVHPFSLEVFGSDIQYLINVNLLNSSSVFIVLLTFYFFQFFTKNKEDLTEKHQIKLESFLIKIYPFVVLVGILGVVLHLLFFPISENLLIRSLIDKLSIFTSFSILIYGFLYGNHKSLINFFALLLFALAFFNGFLAFSKFNVISTLLVFVIGLLIRRHSTKNIIACFSAIFLTYILINPIVSYGRASIEYKPNSNSIMDRINIVSGLFLSYKNDSSFEIQPSELVRKVENIQDIDTSFDSKDIEFITKTFLEVVDGREVVVTKNIKQIIVDEVIIETITTTSRRDFTTMREHINLNSLVRNFAIRFDVASIQGYLINEYNSGRNGNTLGNFLVILVPRVLWPAKPIMTNDGGKLNSTFFGGGTGTELSASAPTYSAEAYWNYGVMGVLLISIYLGVIIGWFSNLAYKSLGNNEPSYLLIAFPAIIIFAGLESWIVPSYIGGLGILIVIFLFFKLLFFISNRIKW
jgi:hypothetical protein